MVNDRYEQTKRIFVVTSQLPQPDERLSVQFSAVLRWGRTKNNCFYGCFMSTRESLSACVLIVHLQKRSPPPPQSDHDDPQLGCVPEQVCCLGPVDAQCRVWNCLYEQQQLHAPPSHPPVLNRHVLSVRRTRDVYTGRRQRALVTASDLCVWFVCCAHVSSHNPRISSISRPVEEWRLI